MDGSSLVLTPIEETPGGPAQPVLVPVEEPAAVPPPVADDGGTAPPPQSDYLVADTNFALRVVGRIPGGLGHVNIASSLIFSGMSGSALADVAGLGEAQNIPARTPACGEACPDWQAGRSGGIEGRGHPLGRKQGQGRLRDCDDLSGLGQQFGRWVLTSTKTAARPEILYL